jgi:ABC-type dipeptide/oligopeptide/nickel transport system permease subunit
VTELMSSTVLEPSTQEAEEALSGDAQGLTAKALSPRRMAWQRFIGHKPAVVCAVVLFLMIIFVALAPITARYGVNEPIFKTTATQSNRYLSPRAEAWFGTDEVGRDLYSRLIYGTRVSLVIGLAAALIGVVIGTAVGAWAGIKGGFFDDLMMRVTDLFLAFPFLVALLVVRNMLGAVSWLEPILGDKSSIRFIILLLALFGWMPVARVVRGQVLALKEREFIEASRSLGATNRRIVLRHLLPNSVGPILVALTFSVVAAIIAEATLSFFGFGPQPGADSTSLGLLVASSKENVLSGNWWMVVFPCGVLLLVALTINMVGDGLRDATDPKMQRTHS